MPYMNCNGRTVSRHSNTAEVKKCKAIEKEINQKQYNKALKEYRECEADPVCASKFSVDDFILILFSIAIILALGLVISLLHDLFKGRRV